MIIKTNKKNDQGRDIYEHAITGESGTLNEITVHASMRSFIRHGEPTKNRVRTNRKTTLGRSIYFQLVNKITGKKEVCKRVRNQKGKITLITKEVNVVEPIGEVIKHVQETPNALRRKIALFNFYERIEILKNKWHNAHPEYQKKAV